MSAACNVLIVILTLFAFIRFSQQDVQNVEQQLYEYGYTDSLHVDLKTLEEALKRFQNAHGIAETGMNDEETQKKLTLPRCGRPDGVPMTAVSRSRWSKRSLTYGVFSRITTFSQAQIENAIENSINLWTTNVNLQITKSRSNRADIEVYFTHQDNRNGVLGYAYFPQVGDIYFDADENWTLDQKRAGSATYFGWVATHELGHALGLPHTQSRDSIMFPYYNPSTLGPSSLDYNHIRDLYGRQYLETENLCAGNSTDALLNYDTLLIIQGKHHWNMTESGVSMGPFALDNYFPDLPDKIDAAFAVDKTTYFFRGNAFYKYTPKKKKPQKKLISFGFENLESNIDAAFYDAQNKTIYFFKGSKYYMFHTKATEGKRLDAGMAISEGWKGLPNDIDAAESLNNDSILFIKGDRCYHVNTQSKEVVSEEMCSSKYFKC